MKTDQEKAHDQYMKFRAEHRARSLVRKAIKSGTMTKMPCECCGSTEKVEAHHNDYNKPLEVSWLCVKCHRRWHTNNEPIRAPYVKRTAYCCFCGTKFVPYEKHNTYCSDECKLNGRREVNRRSFKNNGYKYTKAYKRIKAGDYPRCSFCGEEFVPSGTTKYCSDECRHNARLKQKRDAYKRQKSVGTIEDDIYACLKSKSDFSEKNWCKKLEEELTEEK